MSYKISKELLSEVLGINIDENDIYVTNNYIYYAYCRRDNEWINPSLNIYELVHKCKNWALKQGYMIESYLDLESNGVSVIRYENKYISAETEQQAVFDACQWILDNKDKR